MGCVRDCRYHEQEDIMNNSLNRDAKIPAGISSQFVAIVSRTGQMKANKLIFVRLLCIFCIQTFFIHSTTCSNAEKVLSSFHNDQAEGAYRNQCLVTSAQKKAELLSRPGKRCK